MIEEPEKVRVGVTKTREFGGAIGSFFMVLGLPVTVLGLNILCSQVCIMNWTLLYHHRARIGIKFQPW